MKKIKCLNLKSTKWFIFFHIMNLFVVIGCGTTDKINSNMPKNINSPISYDTINQNSLLFIYTKLDIYPVGPINSADLLIGKIYKTQGTTSVFDDTIIFDEILFTKIKKLLRLGIYRTTQNEKIAPDCRGLLRMKTDSTVVIGIGKNKGDLFLGINNIPIENRSLDSLLRTIIHQKFHGHPAYFMVY